MKNYLWRRVVRGAAGGLEEMSIPHHVRETEVSDLWVYFCVFFEGKFGRNWGKLSSLARVGGILNIHWDRYDSSISIVRYIVL